MAKSSLTIGLLLSLLFITTSPISASTEDTAKWYSINIPTEGDSGNWMLASGSDIQHLTMAIDGTLYCHANPSGTSYRLFKSTDGGFSWSHTGKIKDNIVDIATDPDDASVIYYATSSSLYKSTDAGSSFIQLPPNPGGAGTDGVVITSIEVNQLEGHNVIAVGTRDTDDGQYGGIYILDESELLSEWADTNIDGYDALAVAFSPSFSTDRQLVAVVTDEKDTLVTCRINDGGWGETTGNATIEGLVPKSACIAFPEDYDATIVDNVLFVGIDSDGDNGDVYRINSATAPGISGTTDLNIGTIYGLSDVDVATLAVTGNTLSANIMAGLANSAQVYFSTDGGNNWTKSTKEPTGQSDTSILMASNFASSGRAYAATSGTESGFSITQDGGVTWNQVGLIDTAIGIGNILDLAIFNTDSQHNTLFMLTFDGKHSLWRSLDDGISWERVFGTALANVDSLDKVELSTQNQAVYLAGTTNGNPTIWQSRNNGQVFKPRSTPFPIDTWAVADDDTIFIGSYDGSAGVVYCTTNGGLSYSTGSLAGNQPLKSIALSPDYEEDKTILAGNTNDGLVYWSNDNGATFEQLGQQLPQLIAGTGVTNDVMVAFDPRFNTNDTVYAASHCSKGTEHSSAIYRFVIGDSTEWESIDSTLPESSILSQLAVSADGTLYTSNSKADGGMERSLNPTYALGPSFETVTRGLDDGSTLSGLWLHDSRLWSIDTENTKLMTYRDSMTQPVTLNSPLNQAPGTGTIINYTISDVNIKWDTLEGTTSYKWQINYLTDFSSIPDGFEGNTQSTSARLPSLEPATAYYWRVRAIEPVLSPWSAKWSFTTTLGYDTVAPQLISPEAGASGVSIEPIFQWSAIEGADSCELLVATDAAFTNLVITKTSDHALPSTAWQCNPSLSYDTTYYWKVRAVGSETNSDWSAVGAFITEAPPESESSVNPAPQMSSSPPSPPSPPSPSASTLSSLPDWIVYVVVSLLLAIILLLSMMLMLMIRTRRL